MRVSSLLNFSSNTPSPQKQNTLRTQEKRDPFELLPNEVKEESKIISPPNLKYVLNMITTKRGTDNTPGDKLPHPFLQASVRPGILPKASVLGVIYKHPKTGEWMLYAHDEYRACTGRRVLTVPGGDIEANETPREAMIREFSEESGNRFQIKSDIETLETPISELPAMTNNRIYLGVAVGEPNKKAPAANTLDKGEVGIINNQKLGGVPISVLLSPAKLREFIQQNQDEIVKTNGKKGRLVEPIILMIAALMGDKIKKLIVRFDK